MDGFNAYTFGTAAWLSLQAVPLLLAPKLVLTLLNADEHHITDLEVYLSRSLALSLLILAIIALFFTGAVPLSSTPVPNTTTISSTSSSNSSTSTTTSTDPKSPFAQPVVLATTLYHASSAIYCYTRYTTVKSSFGPSSQGTTTGYILGGTGYGAMACLGLWCLMFGTGVGRRSKRTGADKRMAGFPFKNESAYNPKKDRKMI